MAYRWLLIHRPHIGLIRLRMFQGTTMVVDSGNLYDSTLKGGRLGVLSFSQEMIIWSDLVYRCNGQFNTVVYLVGKKGLSKISNRNRTLQINKEIKTPVSCDYQLHSVVKNTWNLTWLLLRIGLQNCYNSTFLYYNYTFGHSISSICLERTYKSDINTCRISQNPKNELFRRNIEENVFSVVLKAKYFTSSTIFIHMVLNPLARWNLQVLNFTI